MKLSARVDVVIGWVSALRVYLFMFSAVLCELRTSERSGALVRFVDHSLDFYGRDGWMVSSICILVHGCQRSIGGAFPVGCVHRWIAPLRSAPPQRVQSAPSKIVVSSQTQCRRRCSLSQHTRTHIPCVSPEWHLSHQSPMLHCILIHYLHCRFPIRTVCSESYKRAIQRL